jgi:hypothetical protein
MDVVSFDLFDTLLVRGSMIPTWSSCRCGFIAQRAAEAGLCQPGRCRNSDAIGLPPKGAHLSITRRVIPASCWRRWLDLRREQGQASCRVTGMNCSWKTACWCRQRCSTACELAGRGKRFSSFDIYLPAEHLKLDATGFLDAVEAVISAIPQPKAPGLAIRSSRKYNLDRTDGCMSATIDLRWAQTVGRSRCPGPARHAMKSTARR